VPSGGVHRNSIQYTYGHPLWAHPRLLLSSALGMPLCPDVDGSDAMSSLSVYQITTLPALCIRDILPAEVQAVHVPLIRW
jgi:hypothetical protein